MKPDSVDLEKAKGGRRIKLFDSSKSIVTLCTAETINLFVDGQKNNQQLLLSN